MSSIYILYILCIQDIRYIVHTVHIVYRIHIVRGDDVLGGNAVVAMAPRLGLEKSGDGTRKVGGRTHGVCFSIASHGLPVTWAPSDGYHPSCPFLSDLNPIYIYTH